MDIALRVWYALWTSYEVWLWLQNNHETYILEHRSKKRLLNCQKN